MSAQLTLEDCIASARARDLASTQDRELKRVSGRIAGSILAFCSARDGGRFAASELHAYVNAKQHTAPASVDRVLRMLRQSGQVSYRCVDRAASLYELKEGHHGR